MELNRPSKFWTTFRGIRHFTFAIFTILPFACGSFGSFTSVTHNSFSAVAECDVGCAITGGDLKYA
jgi:hypothetical protein